LDMLNKFQDLYDCATLGTGTIHDYCVQIKNSFETSDISILRNLINIRVKILMKGGEKSYPTFQTADILAKISMDSDGSITLAPIPPFLYETPYERMKGRGTEGCKCDKINVCKVWDGVLGFTGTINAELDPICQKEFNNYLSDTFPTLYQKQSACLIDADLSLTSEYFGQWRAPFTLVSDGKYVNISPLKPRDALLSDQSPMQMATHKLACQKGLQELEPYLKITGALDSVKSQIIDSFFPETFTSGCYCAEFDDDGDECPGNRKQFITPKRKYYYD